VSSLRDFLYATGTRRISVSKLKRTVQSFSIFNFQFSIFKKHIIILSGYMALVCCNGSDSNFAVRNTENITRIELNEKNNTTVLSKTGKNDWSVASFKADMRKIANLKKILSAIEVRCPLPKIYDSAYPNKKITDEGILIKIFERTKNVKSYHLLFGDGEPAEIIGLMHSKQQPYILELPGIDINADDYIVAEHAFWENNILFSYSRQQIKYLKIENRENPNSSFSIKITDSISLFDINGNSIRFDKSKMDAYLSYFNNISFDRNLNITDDEKQRIMSVEPLYIMTVESDTDSLTCFVRPISVDATDDYGNPLVYDRDCFYLTVPQRNLFAKAAWLKFDILLEEPDFLSK
jgi:hypothetical protein